MAVVTKGGDVETQVKILKLLAATSNFAYTSVKETTHRSMIFTSKTRLAVDRRQPLKTCAAEMALILCQGS